MAGNLDILIIDLQYILVTFDVLINSLLSHFQL
jgi:hypothetical protein